MSVQVVQTSGNTGVGEVRTSQPTGRFANSATFQRLHEERRARGDTLMSVREIKSRPQSTTATR